LKKPDDITASCSVKKGAKNSNGILECLTDSTINDKIIIDQNIIYNNNKEDIIIIGAIESNENIKCLNAALNSANNKLNQDLSFRQISQFRSSGGKTTFFLAAITTKNISKKYSIKLNAYLINGESKEAKEVICTLQSEVILSNGQSQKQADFDCVVDGESTDLEIISSDDISGINDLLEYQKSPKKTDEKIIATQNGSDVDKVINYSLPSNKESFTPLLTITKIESNLCQKYGRLTLKVSLDQDNWKKFDIDFTLSYPSTSFKCTVPKLNKNTEVSMLCRIQKEFSDSSGLLIEQTTIKKKNKEILLIKGFKSEDRITCYNYNKKKAENA
jgi:hypothetical protein